jgi:Helix-turn-helix of DDE superfamily endonuclease
MIVSSRALTTLADALRHRRAQRGTRWRRLDVGTQALLVIAHQRKGETYTDLASSFRIGTTTVFRYIREALDVLAPWLPR